MKQIPNLFTLLNLVFGCLAIVFILQTGEMIVLVQPDGFTAVNLPEKLTWGALFIFAAAVVDFLDGFVARLFKATSNLGAQLDSLADVVSFGVAPGLIIYQLLRLGFAQQTDGLNVSIAWLLPAFIFPCAAAWRLAKFNLDAEQKTSFKGLPTPAAGLLVASIPLIAWYEYFGIQNIFINQWVLYLLVVVLSYLMVSNTPLMGLKFKDYSYQKNSSKYFLLVLAIITIIVCAVMKMIWLAVPAIFVFYLVLSLIPKKQLT
jgi:CDP-diacylglycerol--serine O-phosphatidyltransferase